MNGDGKTDLVHISQGVIYVYELNEQYQLKKLIEEHNPLILYKKTLLFTHTIPPVIGNIKSIFPSPLRSLNLISPGP